MSYNWQDASTPQGRERLKELMEGNVAVISMSGDGELSECFIEPDGTIVINHSSYEDWQDVDEMDVLFGIEFIDPSPIQPKDGNGLLPCPFCGGNDIDMYQIGNEWTKKRAYEIKCKTFGCCTTRKVGVITMSLEWAKEKCINRWNTRAGKEANA